MEAGSRCGWTEPGRASCWSTARCVTTRRSTRSLKSCAWTSGVTPWIVGASAPDREFDDVAAVVEAIASLEGTSVALFGHSWGASCAMGGAARTRNVGRLLLYEPSLGLSYPPGSIEVIDAKVASGDFEGAVLFVLVDIAGMQADEVEALRSSSLWPARVATAPTIAREARIEANWVIEPGQFRGIAASTLLLSGSDSPSELGEVVRRSADAIPGARIAILDGHGHFAYRTHPRVVASVIAGFAPPFLRCCLAAARGS